MNPYRLAGTDVRPVRWKLRRPFVTALGQKSYSDNVLVRLRLAGGAEGWGEASSSLAMAFQTGPAMASALRRLGRKFAGADVRELEEITRQAWRSEGGWPTAAAAFEVALWDAFARQEKISLWRLWGGAARELETVLSISSVAPEQVASRARAAARRGWRFLKLKLNGGEGQPLNRGRVRAAARAAPKARLLLDPNQSYRPESLESLLTVIRWDGIGIELVEEPFPKRSWSMLAARRAKSPPVILDESVQNAADAGLICRGRLASGVNIKLAKSGVAGARAILAACRGLARPKFMIGCMAESRAGLSASAVLAMALGVFSYVDLDSDLLLTAVPVSGGYRRSGPWLSLPKNPAPGLGLRISL